jgi:hypothetical protein
MGFVRTALEVGLLMEGLMCVCLSHHCVLLWWLGYAVVTNSSVWLARSFFNMDYMYAHYTCLLAVFVAMSLVETATSRAPCFMDLIGALLDLVYSFVWMYTDMMPSIDAAIGAECALAMHFSSTSCETAVSCASHRGLMFMDVRRNVVTQHLLLHRCDRVVGYVGGALVLVSNLPQPAIVRLQARCCGRLQCMSATGIVFQSMLGHDASGLLLGAVHGTVHAYKWSSGPAVWSHMFTIRFPFTTVVPCGWDPAGGLHVISRAGRGGMHYFPLTPGAQLQTNHDFYCSLADTVHYLGNSRQQRVIVRRLFNDCNVMNNYDSWQTLHTWWGNDLCCAGAGPMLFVKFCAGTPTLQVREWKNRHKRAVAPVKFAWIAAVGI